MGSKAKYQFLHSVSVQFSRSVMSNCLQPHESQHSRPPCPSATPEFTQTHVHWVGDAIQPSHPLSSPSPAPNPSQHQGLFQWVNSSHEVAKVLEFQPQYQSFQWTPRTGLLQEELVGSPCSPRDSQKSSPAPQFKSINFSALSFLYSLTRTSIHCHWKMIALTRWIFVGKVLSLLFNKLSRLVITFLPRSKHLLISWYLLESSKYIFFSKTKNQTKTVLQSLAIPILDEWSIWNIFNFPEKRQQLTKWKYVF